MKKIILFVLFFMVALNATSVNAYKGELDELWVGGGGSPDPTDLAPEIEFESGYFSKIHLQTVDNLTIEYLIDHVIITDDFDEINELNIEYRLYDITDQKEVELDETMIVDTSYAHKYLFVVTVIDSSGNKVEDSIGLSFIYQTHGTISSVGSGGGGGHSFIEALADAVELYNDLMDILG